MGCVLLDPLFYIYVLWIVVCPFVLFLLVIVLSVLLRYTDSDYPFGIFKLCIIIVLARLRVVDSDNLDEYKCLLLLNLFAASYNKKQSGNVYLMKILCKSQLFNTFILLCFSPLF